MAHIITALIVSFFVFFFGYSQGKRKMKKELYVPLEEIIEKLSNDSDFIQVCIFRDKKVYVIYKDHQKDFPTIKDFLDWWDSIKPMYEKY